MSKKRTLLPVGWTVTGKTIVGGLFKMADTYGFPLSESIIELRKRGCVPDLLGYVADAVLAGWTDEKAVKDVLHELQFTGDFNPPEEFERGLQMAAGDPQRFSTKSRRSTK